MRVTGRQRVLPALACAALVLVTACHRSADSITFVTIEHELTPQPAQVGPATIILRLKDVSGKAITGAHVTLEANMSHAGMGPARGEAKEVAPGRYQTTLEFSMGGDWIVLIHLSLPDGQKLERHFEIKGVRSK